MSDIVVHPRSTKATFGERWRTMSMLTRVLLSFLLACVAYQVVASFTSGITGTSNQVSGSASSRDDSALGTAAFADLLSRAGVHVTELISPISSAGQSSGRALLLLDPTQWSTSQATAAAALVRAGATVIASGADAPTAILRALGSGAGVTWSSTPVGAVALVPTAPLVPGPGTVDSPSTGSFTLSSRARVRDLAGPATDSLAVAVHDGGWLVALASASPLQNSSLALADNASFDVNLVATTATHATFDEYVHGIGRGGSGLAGLPAPWRYGLGLALLGVLIGIVGALRRFGPVQRADRATLPPRVRYVNAMATHLETKKRDEVVEATAPVSRALRTMVTARLSQPPDASDAALRGAAALAPEHRRAYERLVERATTPARSPAETVAVGHALAQLAHSTFDEMDADD